MRYTQIKNAAAGFFGTHTGLKHPHAMTQEDIDIENAWILLEKYPDLAMYMSAVSILVHKNLAHIRWNNTIVPGPCPVEDTNQVKLLRVYW